MLFKKNQIIFLSLLLILLSNQCFSENYEVYVSNEKFASTNSLEFDVFIKNNSLAAPFSLRSFQCGYQFSPAFINGGTINGAYLSGSSDFSIGFGVAWGFRFNPNYNVLSQSANIGGSNELSSLTSNVINSTAKKIGRFRITNTNNWGCANSGITIIASGSSFLKLAITKYNSVNGSDKKCADITSGSTYNTIRPDYANQGGCLALLNLNLFIQGYYSGLGKMVAPLFDLGISNDPTSCDTVEVNLWSPARLNQDYADYSTKGILHTDGTLTTIWPGLVYGGSYYVAIKHRNSIETWSAHPVSVMVGSCFNFTDSASAAFGNNMGQLELSKWAIYSGDLNQDGAVDIFDYLLLDPDIQNGVGSEYLNTDINADGAIDIFDYLLLDPNIQDGVGKYIAQ